MKWRPLQKIRLLEKIALFWLCPGLKSTLRALAAQLAVVLEGHLRPPIRKRLKSKECKLQLLKEGHGIGGPMKTTHTNSL